LTIAEGFDKFNGDWNFGCARRKLQFHFFGNGKEFTVKRFSVYVNEEFCKGCGICVHFCPKKAIQLSPEFNRKGVNAPIPSDMAKCTGCRTCELYCPDFAIAIAEIEEAA
jgi:2-oxoglutarate ferredoxin oxidoreductase subunit delta